MLICIDMEIMAGLAAAIGRIPFNAIWTTVSLHTPCPRHLGEHIASNFDALPVSDTLVWITKQWSLVVFIRPLGSQIICRRF
ncbi:hypothetical protein C463_04279 [Halorubrum californiense DSM 19288]|uniref:Uncharacterized protein n=1 Tax=Halorubrum californiense DSM 19288 TaxID=1227465 RepID=M0EH51_9EURY|nr:hypothetical protein C463_04279 [Halorubrum californiense DSM 19288]